MSFLQVFPISNLSPGKIQRLIFLHSPICILSFSCEWILVGVSPFLEERYHLFIILVKKNIHWRIDIYEDDEDLRNMFSAFIFYSGNSCIHVFNITYWVLSCTRCCRGPLDTAVNKMGSWVYFRRCCRACILENMEHFPNSHVILAQGPC